MKARRRKAYARIYALRFLAIACAPFLVGIVTLLMTYGAKPLEMSGENCGTFYVFTLAEYRHVSLPKSSYFCLTDPEGTGYYIRSPFLSAFDRATFTRDARPGSLIRCLGQPNSMKENRYNIYTLECDGQDYLSYENYCTAFRKNNHIGSVMGWIFLSIGILFLLIWALLLPPPRRMRSFRKYLKKGEGA